MRLLRVHPDNPRYVTDDGKRAIFLAGSHTWATIQERGEEGKTPDFDYPGYLDFMQQHGHNFLRLWVWEHATWMQFTERANRVRYKPTIYQRTGPGEALDGGPKFDVARFNDEYFERLRQRVAEAGRRGIFCGVMLFQGFSIEQKGTEGVDPKLGNAWDGHPFNRANNINGIDGDPNANGEGEEVHTLAVPEVTRLQEAYVARVIDTLGDLDHIIWEISNESHKGSVEWQYHMVRFIHNLEAKRGGRRHLVWMSAPVPHGNNRALFNSPAEVISPLGGGYLRDPEAADGRKIVVVDTDHISPWKAEPLWVWRNLLRGNHYILMDAFRDYRAKSPKEPVRELEPARKAMGYAVALSRRADLARLAPHNGLASTRYCLARPGAEYVVLQPDKGAFTVTLPDRPNRYSAEWTGALDGTTRSAEAVQAGGTTDFVPPFDAPAVLHLKAAAE